MKKYYLYNASFFHSTGNGSVQMYCNRKIKTYKQFEDLRQDIEKINNLEGVAIINLQLIGKEYIEGGNAE